MADGLGQIMPSYEEDSGVLRPLAADRTPYGSGATGLCTLHRCILQNTFRWKNRRRRRGSSSSGPTNKRTMETNSFTFSGILNSTE